MMKSKPVRAEPRAVLAEYHWERRVVVVLQASQEDKIYDAQLEEFDAMDAQREGWRARQLVLYTCSHDGGGVMRDHSLASQETPEKVSQETCRRLRAYAEDRIEGAGGVYLVGKDGGIKLAQDGIFETRELFELIDSMPMRQREMRSTSR